jgi:hypothetical protein
MNGRTSTQAKQEEGELLYFTSTNVSLYKWVNPPLFIEGEDGGVNTHNSSLTSHLSIIYSSPLKLSINWPH